MKLKNKILLFLLTLVILSCQKKCYDCYQIGNYTQPPNINYTYYGDTIEVCGDYKHEDRREVDEYGGETYVYWNCKKK